MSSDHLVLLFSFAVAVYVFRRFLFLPWVWFVGAAFVYFLCTAGVVYDIIHGIPFSVVDPRTRKTTYISNRARHQYGAEGFLMSAAILLGGLGLVAITEVVPRIRNRSSQRLTGLLCLSLTCLCFYEVISVYRYKNSWYGPGFLPPAWYRTGPLARDQGFSF
eukprot:GILK01005032.1.p1 GENE.GILK01005032.1~~GILK01005032.1.p1  ORF type:complete len:175 (+),score=1.68 GILK01005032.1:40-525(+)